MVSSKIILTISFLMYMIVAKCQQEELFSSNNFVVINVEKKASGKTKLKSDLCISLEVDVNNKYQELLYRNDTLFLNTFNSYGDSLYLK